MEFNEEMQMWDTVLPDPTDSIPFVHIRILHIDHLFAGIKACEKRHLTWAARASGHVWYLGFHMNDDVIKAAQGKCDI